MRRYKLGLVIKLEHGIEASFNEVHQFGLPTCQISTYVPELLTEENAALILDLESRLDVAVSLVWAGWPGRVVWDFMEGPDTVGLVPMATRVERTEIIKRASDFAKALGVDSVATHVGFIPEAPSDPAYKPLVEVIAGIADYCNANGQYFCMETGQETPITLLRAIEDVARENLRINFDPANLVLYGKGCPVAAVVTLGRFVQGVHIKDGRYPVNGRELGEETLLGHGQVDLPQVLQSLQTCGFNGPLSIETDLSGPPRNEAIAHAIRYLTHLVQ